MRVDCRVSKGRVCGLEAVESASSSQAAPRDTLQNVQVKRDRLVERNRWVNYE